MHHKYNISILDIVAMAVVVVVWLPLKQPLSSDDFFDFPKENHELRCVATATQPQQQQNKLLKYDIYDA